MHRIVEGQLRADKRRFALVTARFNDFVTSRLAAGAIDALVRHGCNEADITEIRVPGSFEVPLAAQRVAAAGKVDAVICLGCLIRGQTPHFEYIASEVTKGIAQASMHTGIPMAYGIITADTLEQAIDRAGAKGGNKGAEAALSAIEMVSLLGELGPS
jgi:6,7-dimethyl-8-ribityllumazine synthase